MDSEMLFTFLKGLLVGLTVALPIGPVGLLCLERTTCRGWRMGLSTILGMNLADIITAFAVLLGVGFITDFATAHGSIFKVIVGAIFLGVGAYLLHTRAKEAEEKREPKDLAYGGVSAFLLSFSPTTILMMILLFPLLGVGSSSTLPMALLGVAFGSFAWGMGVLFAGKKLKEMLSGDKMTKFRTILGLLFIILGVGSAILAILPSM